MFTKKLQQKAGGSEFEDRFVQITLYAANQKYKNNKEDPPVPLKPSQAMFKEATLSGKASTAPIVLGSPLLLNLSVRRPPPHSAPWRVTHLAPQEHVSVGSDGRFLDEAAPKSVTISLADCTLTFSIMYKRVAPAAKTWRVLSRAVMVTGQGGQSQGTERHSRCLRRMTSVDASRQPM